MPRRYHTHMYSTIVFSLCWVQVLRYVGVVDVEKGGGPVEPRRYPKDHAFAQLSGERHGQRHTSELVFTAGGADD